MDLWGVSDIYDSLTPKYSKKPFVLHPNSYYTSTGGEYWRKIQGASHFEVIGGFDSRSLPQFNTAGNSTGTEVGLISRFSKVRFLGPLPLSVVSLGNHGS